MGLEVLEHQLLKGQSGFWVLDILVACIVALNGLMDACTGLSSAFARFLGVVHNTGDEALLGLVRHAWKGESCQEQLFVLPDV